MPLFDSLVNTFGTAGTGGFAIKNASIGSYNSAYVDGVITVFMLLFGINFNLYFLLLMRDFKQVLKSEELRVYLGVALTAMLLIALNILPQYGGFGVAFRYSAFQVSSIMTTTGYRHRRLYPLAYLFPDHFVPADDSGGLRRLHRRGAEGFPGDHPGEIPGPRGGAAGASPGGEHGAAGWQAGGSPDTSETWGCSSSLICSSSR